MESERAAAPPPWSAAAPWLWAVAAVGIVAIALPGLAGGTSLHVLLDDLMQLAAAAVASALAWRKARAGGPKDARGWLLLGGAAAVFAAGQLAWTWTEAVQGRPPFPGAADIGFLAFYPLAFAALLVLFALPDRHGLVRAALVLDGVLVCLAAFVIAWPLALDAAFDAPGDPAAKWLSVAYPVLDLVLLGMAGGTMMRNRGSWRSSLGLAFAGLLGIFLADLNLSTQAFAGAYVTGEAADAGWMVGFLLLGAAALAPPPQAPVPSRTGAMLGRVMPVLAILALVASSLLIRRLHADRDPVWGAAAFLLLLGALLRQAINEREHVVLAREAHQAEAQYRDIVQSASLGILRTSPDGSVLFANDAFARMVGYPSAPALLDARPTSSSFYARPEQRQDVLAMLQAQGKAEDFPMEFRRRDGTTGWVRGNLRTVRGPDQRIAYLEAFMTEVTREHRLSQDLHRTQRTLRVLSLASQALVQAKDEKELQQQVCDLLVGPGGYRLAWLGVAEDGPGKPVRPVAWAGYDAGYHATVRASWDANDERGQGPTGRCLRSGQTQVAQDILNDPLMAPWRADAVARGYAASCSLFLQAGDKRAALMVYAPEPDAFAAEEVRLLEELAADLAYGIKALREKDLVAKAEAERQKLQARYTSLVENASEGIFETTVGGEIVFMNAAGARIFGYDDPDQMRREVPDIRAVYADPAQRDDFVAHVRRNGGPFEVRLRRRDGSELWAVIRASLVRQPDGTTHLQGLMEDQTERRAAEAARAAAERQRLEAADKLQAMVQASLDAIITMDDGGRVVEFNPAAEHLFGFARSEAVGNALADLIVPPEQREAHARGVRRAAASGLGPLLNRRVEMEALRKDGRRIPIELTVVPVSSDGGPPMFAGFLRDLSAEHGAREATGRLASIVENSHDAIYSIDLQGRVVSWNQGAALVYGHTAEEAMGRPLDDLVVPPSGRAEFQDMLARLARGETVARSEVERVHKDGHRLLVSKAASPLRDAHGRIVGGALTSHDVTAERAAAEARQRLEAQDREVKRLQELNRMRIDFLNTAAHDLKTPLTPLKLQMATLRLGQLAAKDRSALELMERNVNRFQVLVEDMLDAARLQSGRLTLRRASVELGPLVQEALASFTEAARQGGLQVDARIDAGVRIDADPAKCMQVLMNLVSNAVKYTPPGGHVQVRVSGGEREATISVRDDGLGMTREQMDRLFQPFVRLHEGQPGVAKGTGLGLYICKGIVEQHGGRILVDSDGPGHGSTFTVAWPLAAQVTPATAQPQDTPRQP